MKLCSIASGSSGNCIYLATDHTQILIDSGISGKRTEAGLNEIGTSLKEIDAILVTHEHVDHISGIGVISRKYGIPIFGSNGTIRSIEKTSSIGKVDPDLLCAIEPDRPFCIKDFEVSPIRISHDASEPLAYRLSHQDKKIAVMTDLGFYNDYIINELKGLDAILLEANHDVNMLQVGPYPYYLKKRILGDKGHLSNELAGRLLCEILHDGMKQILLGHLSKENNLAELAYETVRMEVTMADIPYNGNDFPIRVADRSCVSEMIEV